MASAAAAGAAAAGGGGPAPSYTGTITPEIHFKMCKKVAQLTKVIYHLNLRNEDNDQAVELLRIRYEEQMRKSAVAYAEQLQKLKDAVEKNEEAAKAKEAYEQLKAQYDKHTGELKEMLSSKEREMR